MDTAIRKKRLVEGTEESVSEDNNMAQCNKLCGSKTCFCPDEVKTDNLNNCSVLNENVAVVCQKNNRI